ncbi:DNA glycosylase AlkZ-like family protein, partial [Eggerthella sinensis]|uniref:DNA glycosylase AlkZ-like family protein n=1 Tax=Eggerthella sinensis TaxID=242230 RepID=UPI0022DFCFC8
VEGELAPVTFGGKVEGELAPVTFGGKRAWVLAEDVERLAVPEPLERDVLLLAGHDPYLDQRDRATLQANPILQRKIWRTVANPGVVVRRGEAVGTWTPRKKGAGMTVACELWDACPEKTLRDLAERYTAFRGQKLLDVTIETV